MSRPAVSAIIPVYNDREALSAAIPRSLEILDALGEPFELIVAEDGSRREGCKVENRIEETPAFGRSTAIGCHRRPMIVIQSPGAG